MWRFTNKALKSPFVLRSRARTAKPKRSTKRCITNHLRVPCLDPTPLLVLFSKVHCHVEGGGRGITFLLSTYFSLMDP